jgi:hypothetical protein
MSLHATDLLADALAALDAQGFAFVEGARMQAALEQAGPLQDWAAFRDSWDAMPLDTHMADGGRYRRRRHAVFAADEAGRIERQPHQPHWQSRDYNPLNGGVERWFEPVPDAIANGDSLRRALATGHRLAMHLHPAVAHWRVEVHQFRIVASPGQAGLPTPEGMHRDGVDVVLVLLVRRENIASGTTTIHALDRTQLGSFTLARPFDAALVDDRRVFHGVTAVQPLDPSRPAFRDVLVVTFRRR